MMQANATMYTSDMDNTSDVHANHPARNPTTSIDSDQSSLLLDLPEEGVRDVGEEEGMSRVPGGSADEDAESEAELLLSAAEAIQATVVGSLSTGFGQKPVTTERYNIPSSTTATLAPSAKEYHSGMSSTIADLIQASEAQVKTLTPVLIQNPTVGTSPAQSSNTLQHLPFATAFYPDQQFLTQGMMGNQQIMFLAQPFQGQTSNNGSLISFPASEMMKYSMPNGINTSTLFGNNNTPFLQYASGGIISGGMNTASNNFPWMVLPNNVMIHQQPSSNNQQYGVITPDGITMRSSPVNGTSSVMSMHNPSSDGGYDAASRCVKRKRDYYEEDDEELLADINNIRPRASSNVSKKDVLYPKPNAGGVKHIGCCYADCPYRTDRSYLMKTHLKYHAEEQMGMRTIFRCPHPDCGYIASDSSNLKVHDRVHTGLRPFRCYIEGCNYTSIQSNNLKTHQRKVHGMLNPPRARSDPNPAIRSHTV